MVSRGRDDGPLVAAVGLVSITGVALAAGSISTVTAVDGPTRPPRTGGLAVGPGGGGGGWWSGLSGGGPPVGAPVDATACVELLQTVPGTLAFFGLFGLVLYGIRRQYDAGTAVLGLFGTSPFVLTAYFLNTDCAAGPVGDPPPRPPVPPAPGDWPTSVAYLSNLPDVVVLAALGVVLAGVAAVIARSSVGRTAATAPGGDRAADGPADATDLAAAAGLAADRLEANDADADNEVYRAWWRMTRLLDVPDPEAATPGEFERAAVDAGMDAEHVGLLRTLFEEVRYGERDAASRESRADEVFRTIEAEYDDAP